MNDDLISRKAVISILIPILNAKGDMYLAGRIIEAIDSISPVYDVDKVVDKLEESDLYIDQEKCITVEDAIKIVKGGFEI